MSLKSNKGGRLLRFVRRLLAAPLVLLAAVIILLEDWLWDDLQRLAAAIGRLPVFRALESLIVGLPPYASLACFGVPTVLLVPVKLAALYFISHGRPTLGLLTVIFAKVAGTALVARIFTLTRPSLLRIGWFSVLYTWFVAFKARIYGAIRASYVYRAAHVRYLRTRRYLRGWLSRRKGFLRRRWGAALKLSRKRRQEQE
ncbi:MAG TPA: hypothetical protein VFV34_11800 [Blastocatellia bacterium]|nr:hypothetical protein [Blastocatellia bacterium]